VCDTALQIGQSSERASFPADWEASVSTDLCISQITNSNFDSWSSDCRPPVGHCSQKVVGTAQRSVVSRRPFKRDVDRRVGHGTSLNCGVRATHNICWRSNRSLVESVLSLYKWSGSESLSLIVHEVIHWFIQVVSVLNPIGSYNIDVGRSRSAEVMAAHSSVYKILCEYQTLY